MTKWQLQSTFYFKVRDKPHSGRYNFPLAYKVVLKKIVGLCIFDIKRRTNVAPYKELNTLGVCLVVRAQAPVRSSISLVRLQDDLPFASEGDIFPGRLPPLQPSQSTEPCVCVYLEFGRLEHIHTPAHIYRVRGAIFDIGNVDSDYTELISNPVVADDWMSLPGVITSFTDGAFVYGDIFL